jgi:protein-L-isoaspartate(D-aspartate) O-methyltransferase
MKPMSEAHFAILRRHMVEVIGIQVDLASEELGKAALDERVLAVNQHRTGTPPIPCKRLI